VFRFYGKGLAANADGAVNTIRRVSGPIFQSFSLKLTRLAKVSSVAAVTPGASSMRRCPGRASDWRCAAMRPSPHCPCEWCQLNLPAAAGLSDFDTLDTAFFFTLADLQVSGKPRLVFDLAVAVCIVNVALRIAVSSVLRIAEPSTICLETHITPNAVLAGGSNQHPQLQQRQRAAAPLERPAAAGGLPAVCAIINADMRITGLP